MNKKRYIIIDSNMGVFLGTYDGHQLGKDDDRMYTCFAENNPFGLTTACSFKSHRAANHFIKDMFPHKKHLELESLPVETQTEFPTVVEIIKAGYSEHCGDMLDTMFAEGPQTIH